MCPARQGLADLRGRTNYKMTRAKEMAQGVETLALKSDIQRTILGTHMMTRLLLQVVLWLLYTL